MSSSILTIFWNVHEIPNKKMQVFFKKISKIQTAKTMIYITEFDVNSSTISHGLKRASKWRAKGSDAGPNLKAPFRKSSIFQVSDILHTGTDIKHDITCRYHPYHTK